MSQVASGDESPNLDSRIDEIHAKHAAQHHADVNQQAAAVYVRVCGSGQSIENQVRDALQLAAANNIAVSREHIFYDQVVGGFVSARPGLQALKQLLDVGQVKTLVVVSLNRLLRSARQLNEFLGVYLGRGLSVIHGHSSRVKRSPLVHVDAAVVREIFEMSAAGKSFEEIAEHLNAKN